MWRAPGFLRRVPWHQAFHALESEVRREHAGGQPAQVQLGRHAGAVARGRADAVHLHRQAAGADRQRGAQGMAQPFPAVLDLRAHLPRQALRGGEQVGAGHHALGRHLEAGDRIEQRAAYQQRIHAAQRGAGFAVAGRHAVGDGDLGVARGRVQAVFHQLAMALHPQVVDVAVGQVQQAVGLSRGGGGAVEHLGGAVVLGEQPAAVFQFLEQRAGLQHAREAGRRDMHVVLMEQRQHLLGVRVALGIPFENRLVRLKAPGRRLRQRHGIHRNLVFTHAGAPDHGLGGHLARGLLQPRPIAHNDGWPARPVSAVY